MPSQTAVTTIQKYILLATGIPSSSTLRDQLSQLYDQTGDFSQIVPLVDDFMAQQVLQNEKGVSGVLQTIASNGFSLDLTDLEANQLVTGFLAQDIDSWAELFASLTTDIDAELGATLNNRAEAANLFTDLLAERNLDNSYNSTHGAQDTREWLDGIDASNESLLVANASVQSLVNSLITVELSELEQNDNNNGFVINGVSDNDRSGYSVSNAGDVNGDGFADLIVGAPSDDPNIENNDFSFHEGNSGASFVVFGKTDGTKVELSDIESGTGGFVINGVSERDFSGGSVSSAGDVNGDGLADLIAGASGDEPNGFISGASFVVFGKTDSTKVELSDIESGTGGFVINGVSDFDRSGDSVSNAGDVNSDGFADLIVGAHEDSPSGTSFVVFGGQGSTATIGTSGIDTLTGNSDTDQLVAGAGDDILLGNGGADVLRGGAGNDILAISDLTFASLDGGTGIDTLRFDVPLDIDLRTLADTKLDSIEVIDLTNDGGNSTISLNLTDLLNLNEAQTAADTLVIHGNAGDIVNLDNTSNGQVGNWSNTDSGVYEFTAGEIGIIGTATIDTAVTVNVI